MPDYPALVKRLRSHPVTNYDDDAATAIETLLAQRKVLVDQLSFAMKSREAWKRCATRTDASEDDTTEPDQALKDWGLI